MRSSRRLIHMPSGGNEERENARALQELSSGTNLQQNYQSRFTRRNQHEEERYIWPSSRLPRDRLLLLSGASQNSRSATSSNTRFTNQITELLHRIQLHDNGDDMSYESLLALDDRIKVNNGIPLEQFKKYSKMTYKMWHENPDNEKKPDCIICFEELFKKEYVLNSSSTTIAGNKKSKHRYIPVIQLPCNGNHCFVCIYILS
jgi:hypothetical protein